MDVAAWLRRLGLGQYEQAFRDNAVDGEVLANLTPEAGLTHEKPWAVRDESL